jgi:hypothetical protein
MDPQKIFTQARKFVHTDWAKAVSCAEQIKDPWRACQAFAWCGRFAPASQSPRLIEEAFRQANAGKDEYQRLSATAWPLRALIELEAQNQAAREFKRLSPLTSTVTPPSSRSEACFLVYQAVASIDTVGLGKRALHWLLSASQPVQHWRQALVVREAVMQAAYLHFTALPALLPLVKDQKLRNNIAARIDRGEQSRPRPFFWTGA